MDEYNLHRKSVIILGFSDDLCLKTLFLLELILKPAGELRFNSLLACNVPCEDLPTFTAINKI